jgi:IS5 family transposase
VRLRQSYLRVAKHAVMMAGRYAHAKQFNRHRKQLRFLRSRLGRIIRDIGRKIALAVIQGPKIGASNHALRTHRI